MKKSLNLLLTFLFIFGSAAIFKAQSPAPSSSSGNKKEITTADVEKMLADLQAAIEKDDYDGTLKIISAGFPSDFTDRKTGTSLLMLAAQGGKSKALTVLLAGDANPNRIDANGMTALMMAAARGHLETVKLLLAAKKNPKENADPNLRGANRPSALGFAADGNQVEVIKALVKMGADLQLKDEKGYTPLEYAFVNRRQAALAHLRIVYLEKDMTIPRDPFNNKIMWFPETLIAAIGDKDKAKTLKMLALGFDPNAGGTDPLETAINQSFGAGVSMLVFAGADVNRMTKGNFPVWWLAMSDKLPKTFDINILKFLIKAGANLTLKAKNVTPLEFAKLQKNPQFAQILIEAGAK